MKYTLGQAATASGKSKSTISKAIKSGKLSAQKQDDGSFAIDPAELNRVFPLENTETVSSERSRTPQETPENTIEIAVLRAKLEAAERQVEDLKSDRDHWRQQANRLLSSPVQQQSIWQRLFGR